MILNQFFFLLSLSDRLLLAYRKITDFCVLILYSATLSNSFISFITLSVETFRSSVSGIMSSANSDSFTSSLPIWMPFVSFSHLIAMARTSRTMLNSKC